MDNSQVNNGKEPLKWRFDISTFRLIGRDLITDRITALFELVKNCYDANAKRVDIIFYNINSINQTSKILIKDDGIGMTYDDIKDKWMVIGTASKRKNRYSPHPFNRRYVGEKGIGRFAVDKIGSKLNIITKKLEQDQKLNVEINWGEYETLAKAQQMTLFTDIKNDFTFLDASRTESGTTLEITGIHEIWTIKDIDRLYKELTKIISPFYPVNPPFNIYISSNEYPEYKEKQVKSDAVQFASHHAKIDFDKANGTQQELFFNPQTGAIDVKVVPMKSFGGVKMQLYYFDSKAKRLYHQKYKGDETKIDGVKIYRDGLITTPFAEFESHPDKKRDILGVDKRLWRDIFNRISTREVIGVVDITKDENPNIIDATNRQDFVDNIEYRELKAFIIGQLDVFSDVKIFERENSRVSTAGNLEKAQEDVTSFTESIETIERLNPQLKQTLLPLKKQAKQVKSSVNKGLQEYQKAQKEFVRKENIYLSLMSLQEYAINIAHAVRTSLGKVKRRAEFFKNRYPNADLEDLFKEYAIEIYREMSTLNKVIDFMLSYAGSNLAFEEFSVKELIEELFLQYTPRFESERVVAQVDISDNFVLNANKLFFADIFQNLVSNSLNALKNQKDKIIKVTGYIDDNNFVLFFSDNGAGIQRDLWDKVFELYFTTTAETGGSGIGLYIVKTRVEALQGTVEVCDSELKPSGATFKITFPFKK